MNGDGGIEAAGSHVIQFFPTASCHQPPATPPTAPVRDETIQQRSIYFAPGFVCAFLCCTQNSISRLDVLCNASAFGRRTNGLGTEDHGRTLRHGTTDGRSEKATDCKSACSRAAPVDMPTGEADPRTRKAGPGPEHQQKKPDQEQEQQQEQQPGIR